MPTSLDDQYNLLHRWGIAKEPQLASAVGQRIPIDSTIGRGAFERYNFDTTSLSRVHCQFKHAQHLVNENCTTAYSIHFSLQGTTHVTLNSRVDKTPLNKINTSSNNSHTLMRHAPSIWLVKGNLGRYSATIDSNVEVKAFYIEFDDDFMSTLIKQLQDRIDFQDLLLARLIETNGYFSLPLDINPQTEYIIKKAWQLFHTPSPTDAMSLMALKGETLTFTSQILMQSFASFMNTASDHTTLEYKHAYQAKLLIDEYYHQNWTIRELANKSGTNECYLKSQFKQLTTQSIGEYRTQKRMQVAYDLLKQNISVPHVACQTGFNSTDYFIKVFKNYYGCHPASLLTAS